MNDCHCQNEDLHGLLSLEECKTQILHTTCCDTDGFCNFCGFGPEDEDESKNKPNNEVKCPACGSPGIFYVRPTEETWTMTSMPDEDGNCELSDLLDSYHMGQDYLECPDCSKKFDLNLKERP